LRESGWLANWLKAPVDWDSGEMRMNSTDDDDRKFESAADGVTPEDEANVRQRFAAAWNAAVKRGADAKLLDGVKSLWGMLTDPDYVVAWKTKAKILLALGYFISPIDAIPDVTPGVGYLDDAAVVLWVLHTLHEEVAAYRKAKGVDAA